MNTSKVMESQSPITLYNVAHMKGRAQGPSEDKSSKSATAKAFETLLDIYAFFFTCTQNLIANVTSCRGSYRTGAMMHMSLRLLKSP